MLKLPSFLTYFKKKDKDLNECASYHPLSLPYSDLKNFAKILAHRLEYHMPSPINSDQSGFIKSGLAANILRCLLYITDAATESKTPMSVFYLDAMKTLRLNKIEH